MLQNVRDNMKGTLVVVVIMLFVVPMILTGIDSSFLGNVAGTDAAKVEGEVITEQDLLRAIYLRRQQIVSQNGGNSNADYLSDQNLRDPVLDGMIRRLALTQMAKKSGMGISDKLSNKEILSQVEFQTDNKFDAEKYKRLLRGANYTPATYKEEVATGLLLGQQAFGVAFSSFVTESELDSLIRIAQQERSFYSVTIPKQLIDDSVVVTDEELANYYELNKNDFVEAEKVKVDYIELSVGDIAKTVDVAEEDIKQQYEQEAKGFSANSRYEVAHLLIEENTEETIAAVTQKLADGEDFATLVTEYSDDIASKESGGELGVLTLGMFPSEFEKAALALNEGEVSSAVKTDAGTHFIKVLKKITTEAPAYESRYDAIKQQLATEMAEGIFVESLDLLGELTFSSDGLTSAAQALDVSVKTSGYFERGFGSGIATEKVIRDAAYSEDVLVKKHNSSVIELGADRAIVVYVNDYAEEHIRDFSEVKADINIALLNDKKQAQLVALSEEFVSKVKSGENAEELAKAMNYVYTNFENVDRQDLTADRRTVQIAFSVVTDGSETVFDTQTVDGDQVLVAVTSVKAGDRSALNEQEIANFKRQLAGENSRFEDAVFEAKVLETATINIK